MPSGVHRESTRLAIVEQAIADTLERLQDLGASPRVRELRTKAEGYGRAQRAWATRPPTEEQRAALLRLVLELNVEVIDLGKAERG
jgi:glutamyl-tRNA reductase